MTDESEFNTAMQDVDNAINLFKETNPRYDEMTSIINEHFAVQFQGILYVGHLIEELKNRGYSDDDITRMIREYEEKMNKE